MAAEPTLGTRIRRARERKRWTQRRLAAAIGVDRKTVDNWENGRSQPRNSIGALEEVLGSLDGPAPPPVIIPHDLERRLDRLSPEERDYIIDLLTRRRDDAGEELPP